MVKKAGKPVQKKSTKKPSKTVVAKPRQLKQSVRLPSAWRLTKAAADILWQHKGLFIGITLVYGILNLILVQGLASNTEVSSLKSSLDKAFSGQLGSFGSSLSLFVVLVGSSGNGTSQTAGAYQLFLGILTSLAVIWALRQVFTGTNLRVRDSYYRGMYPLVPFMLVLMVVGLQLIPLLIGATLYNTVMTSGIAVHGAEKGVWGMIFALSAILSLYMLCSSLFALYIVTLPDMTPVKALRSARQLVRHRRWIVLRKIICLPIALLAVAGVIMAPIIIWLTSLAQWVFFLLTMFALVAAHAYMYTLYRELLNE